MFRTLVHCDACGKEYMTIKHRWEMPTHCKFCKSIRLRKIQAWKLTDTPKRKLITMEFVDELKTKSTRELKLMLAMGYKGDDYRSIISELGSRPEEEKKIGRPRVPRLPKPLNNFTCPFCKKEFSSYKLKPMYCPLCKIRILGRV